MISKHISCKAQNDNYQRLAKYIICVSETNKSSASEARTTLLASEVSCTAYRNESNNVANHNGEKLLLAWSKGTSIDDDYDLSIKEVVATQALNTRSTKEKTYHLIISFRTEDEEKLTPEIYKEIEEKFAQALGFQEHQRHCGVHKNTDNLHMHIAYNMIHTAKLARHEPFQDYKIRDILCRQIEREYNLSIDNGINPTDTEHKLSDSSANMEARTGEESFESYVLSKKEELLSKLEQASSWQEVHTIFALQGLEVRKSGNGLAIKNRKSKHSIKASRFDRSISYKNLTQQFGIFEDFTKELKAKDWYRKKPLQYNAEEQELWKEFTKLTRLAEIQVLQEKWHKEKIRITGFPISKDKERELLKLARAKELQEINEIRKNLKTKTSNWLKFLQEKAQLGDEHALSILRSPKGIPKEEELSISAYGKYRMKLDEKTVELKERQAILTQEHSKSTKKVLLAVSRMKNTTKEAFTYKITSSGAIVFTFENGGKVIDYGYKVVATEKGQEFADKFTYKVSKVKNKQNSEEIAL